jgi:hypothetical protein
MECKGNAYSGRDIRARHHMARHLRKMHLNPRHVRVTYLRAMHDNMVRHVRSKFTKLVQTMFPLLHHRLNLVAQKY